MQLTHSLISHKPNKTRPAKTIAVALLFTACAVFQSSATASDITLEPLAAAEVRSEQPETTFPTKSLWINGNPGQARQLLLVFDINDLKSKLDGDQQIADAQLILTKAASEGYIGYKYRVKASGITDNQDWNGKIPAPYNGDAESEGESINWQNAPKNNLDDNGLAEEGVVSLGSVRLRNDQQRIDVTDYLKWALGNKPEYGKAEKDKDGRISLWLTATHPVVYRYYGESSEQAPRLEISLAEPEEGKAQSQIPVDEIEKSTAAPQQPRQWASIGEPDGMLNAKRDFGAVGDGETDDTEAIEEAFRCGRPVYLPAGEYRITRTIRAGGRTKIYGAGGEWNPRAHSSAIIRYDGTRGDIALKVEGAHYFQMRNVTVHGGNKAGIGIYWHYSTQTVVEDSAITNTLDHALYMTKTWYAHFNRLYVRNNQNNGITLDRSTDPELAKGPVNYVTFNQCFSSHNGKNNDFDDQTRAATGYGLGSLGYNNMINVMASVFEMNGGAGIYVEGTASAMLFQGCYIEYNAQALIEQDKEQNGKDFKSKPDRESTGRVANIIVSGAAEAVTFDTCYLHPYGGIWLRGEGGGANPVEFRRCVHPSVVWADHNRWEWQGRKPPVADDEVGVIYRRDDGKWRWGEGK